MTNEIYLYGTVGADFWDEECFTAGDVRDQLSTLSGDVTVRINSGGGIAAEGQAIYNLLKAHEGDIHVIIDGAAASAASLIAMAGDTRTMLAGSFMMIHDPASWMVEGRGTEDDHLRAARGLRVVANGYAKVYAQAAGITAKEARDIMRSEAWYDADMAVESGFATDADADQESEIAAQFDYGIYMNSPEEFLSLGSGLADQVSRKAVMAVMAGLPAHPSKGNKMKDQIDSDQTDDEADMSTDDEDGIGPGGPKGGGVAENETEAEMESDADEGDDDNEEDDLPVAAQILDLATALNRPIEEARTLIAQGASLAAATAQMSANVRKESPMGKDKVKSRSPARVTADARDKFKEGAEKALLAKMGLKGGERSELASMTLSEMARRSIDLNGSARTFKDRLSMVGYSFTMAGDHTTSDFAEILSNVMGKAALQGWEEAEETFDAWTRKGVLTDFKETKRVGAGLFAALPEVPEGADYKYGTVGDRGEPIVLSTYGKLLRISRQAIINDDLSIFGMLPRKMGRAARRTIGDLVYGVLTSNPTMADGTALFAAAHNNLAASGSAPTVSSFSKGRTAMRTQKEEDTSLNITPSYFLVPAALETQAEVLMSSTVDPGDNKGHAPNPVAGKAQVISDGRLDEDSATAWYLAANPSSFDTIEVAYLDGNDTPYLEEMNTWTSDGVEMKVRIDAGVSPLDFRTMYKDPGA